MSALEYVTKEMMNHIAKEEIGIKSSQQLPILLI